MKSFQPFSFTLGVASGLVVLFLYAGITNMFGCSGTDCAPAVTNAPSSQNFRQRQEQGGMRNRAGMAERFDMTEEELQQELDNGKTMQDIAREHGMDMPVRTGSGVWILRGAPQSGALLEPMGSGTNIPAMPDSAASPLSASSSSVRP